MSKWGGLAALGALVVACSGGSTGVRPDGGGGGGGGTVNVSEKEPNDGPDVNGAQDLGTLADGTSVVIQGELSSGGNDGTKYTGDFDLYAFDLGDGGSIDVSVDWTANADVDLVIYDAQPKQVVSDGSTAKPAVGKGTVGKGKYMLGLFSKDAGTPYTATLKYTKTAAPSGDGGSCPTEPAQPAAWSGGCQLSLTTPVCATADLTGGKAFELDWSTNTTFCEGPHKIYVAGDPPSSWNNGNYVQFELVSTSSNPDRGMMTRNIGGYLRITAADLAGVSSPSGIYYYRVTSFYGSASEARAFRVIQ